MLQSIGIYSSSSFHDVHLHTFLVSPFCCPMNKHWKYRKSERIIGLLQAFSLVSRPAHFCLGAHCFLLPLSRSLLVSHTNGLSSCILPRSYFRLDGPAVDCQSFLLAYAHIHTTKLTKNSCWARKATAVLCATITHLKNLMDFSSFRSFKIP